MTTIRNSPANSCKRALTSASSRIAAAVVLGASFVLGGCGSQTVTAIDTTPRHASYFLDRMPYGARRVYNESSVQMDKVGRFYRISTGGGVELTENAFVRRYSGVTGSPVLDAYVRRREPGALAATVGLTTASAFAAGWGIASGGLQLSPNLEAANRASVGAGTAAVVGSVATLVFGLLLLRTVSDQDGSAYSHDLPLDVAVAYATYYNDVLLRRIAFDSGHAIEPNDLGVRETPSSFGDVPIGPPTQPFTPREQQIQKDVR